jgi:iron complex outermembrane recepter protein
MNRLTRALASAAVAGVLLGGWAVGGPRVLAAQERADARSATLLGEVVDAQTGQPVAGASVSLREGGRSELTRGDGTFVLARLAGGRYVVVAQRIGFAPAERVVDVAPGQTARLRLELTTSAIQLPGLVVTGTGRARRADEVYRPTTVLGGSDLRRRLGSSLAATLADEPGMAQRFNGPAASQPVVRGLGGDRVLVLEDGLRTGDVATTGGDHAVAIEPLTAERIEVVRGPAGLLYGSNALGGVINVIRDEVPRTRPARVSGTASLQMESVNRGGTAGGSLLVPVGSVVLRGEISGRTAADTRTPLGVLPATAMDGHNAGFGASWIARDGFAGVAVRDYALGYGVPGTFNGQTIPGAHADGIRVELRRTAVRAQGGRSGGVGPFESVEVEGNYVRFQQDEIEQGGVVGTQFGQLLGTANLIARHRHEAGSILAEGAVGAFVIGRDLSVAGLSTGSRPADQVGIAGYAFEELGFGPFRLQGGARYDWSRITPRGRGTLPGVRTREFGALSGSLAALVEPRDGWTVGVSVARAFRTPAIEELFSDGPHLADHSYNIGNPELVPEVGLGADAFLRLTLPRLHGELSLFRNAISDYIYYQAVIDPITQQPVRDPRFGRWDVFQARQDNSVLLGGEGRLQWEALPRLVVEATGAHVRGSRRGDGEALPAIPPLRGTLGLRYDGARGFVGASREVATAQERVGAFEIATPGYALWNAGAGVHWTLGGQLHTVTLQVRNAADQAWRDHLSRIRAVAPQPGRNVQLLYRVAF